MTKHEGQSTHNYRYDAYGQVLPALGNFTDPHNHYTFSGKEWDEALGLYEFGYRLYDPWAGLWLTQDPVRGTPMRPRTLHRYAYAFASPISYYDRYGLQGEGPPEFTPEGAQSGDQCTEAPPLWMGVLSAPWRILPYDFCMPGLGCWGGEEYADWLVNTYYPSLLAPEWPEIWRWFVPRWLDQTCRRQYNILLVKSQDCK